MPKSLFLFTAFNAVLTLKKMAAPLWGAAEEI